MKTPNILWIMSDQHNAGCMSCAGHPDVRTPHLDSIAEDGVQFNSAFCNSAICAPSRASFMLGQYVHTHRITANLVYDDITSHPLSVAAHFRRHGYQTGLIGKGHLPKTWMEDGFEYRRYCDLVDGEANNPLSVDYFRHLVDHELGDAYDLGNLPDEHPGSNLRAFISDIPAAHSVEAWTGDEALCFFAERDTSRPFFLQLSFHRPHDPYAPPKEMAGLYDSETLDLPDSAVDYLARKFAGKPELQRTYINESTGGYPYRPVDESDLRRQLGHYYALITMIDQQIGRVLRYLRETGEYENTIVVYHADHGDFAGEHGLCMKNLGIYESVHRIPFLLKFPGCTSGSTCDELIESVDLYSTLCELSDLPVPEHVEGSSIVGVANGDRAGKANVVCELDSPDGGATLFALRTADSRLVFNLSAPEDGELYDRRADPSELENLYKSRAHQGTRARLLADLLTHVGRYSRALSPTDDVVKRSEQPGFTALIHRKYAQWSKVAPFVDS